ncbi:DUF3299 domain-containing protein [Ferrimonas senticii]|uniref:DUF3299 domain-containing protein n=1 Tax=Ferrimonas senticii TaxID=394566 RepID=UPI0004815259|nr:DUF3299 domain-containing protein [Ferrimonas senticii]
MRSVLRMALLFISVGLTSIATADDYRQLDWPQLMPEAERNLPPPMINHGLDPMGDSMAPFDPLAAANIGQPYGEVIESLNNQKVHIAGFVVPLESDEYNVTEFLLVPYFGACIHVPPPPTNQIIYVKYPKGIPMDIIWDAIWVDGTLLTSGFTVDDSTSTGYSLQADIAYPYDEG